MQGFNHPTDFGPCVLLHNGSAQRGLWIAPDSAQALPRDRFDGNCIELPHRCLSVAELEAAVALLDACGVPHGDMLRLDAFDIAVLAFRDPDNYQVEMTEAAGVTAGVTTIAASVS